MKSAPSLLLVVLLACTSQATPETLSKIGFGSCANEKRPQPIWDAVNALGPDLFILAGDNVYADSGDPAVLEESYRKFGEVPGWAKLRSSCPVVATWDDHDFGANDGGAEWEGKQAAKDAFMNFFKTPEDSPLRSRGGIHDSRVFGPEGRRVQVILLDTRWFRGPLEKLSAKEHKALKDAKGPWNGPYIESETGDSTMLGEEQWAWLEGQLKIPAELRLIVTSIQAVTIDHGWEKWGNLPRERRRLFELIRTTGANGVMFLSGDRHTADVSKLPASTDSGPDYPLFDITSSGLTQGGFSRERNRYRVGTADPFGQQNFGWITVDWDREDPAIRMEIRDADGKVVREAATTLGELKAPI
ncbi:MAG: alkaline phosphatase family protein [Chthoniobacterales bacterium]|nr:alkaline phosphatase family protein [Chthoniobacterales bacterium]